MQQNVMKQLFRSLPKTALCTLLLAASAFFLNYGLLEYAAVHDAYENSYGQYHGYLSVEAEKAPDTPTETPVFFISDREGNPAYDGYYAYEDYHAPDLPTDLIGELLAEPALAAAPRYMTAGISDYERLANHSRRRFYADYNYTDRVILEGTLEGVTRSNGRNPQGYSGGNRTLQLKDVRLLAGKEDSLRQSPFYESGRLKVGLVAVDPAKDMGGLVTVAGNGRLLTATVRNRLTEAELEALAPGTRYVFVCRVDPAAVSSGSYDELGAYNSTQYPYVQIGDEALFGFWPYIVSLAAEPEDYLNTADFAPLRRLIELTEADRRTLDVVYTGDMGAIRSAWEGKLLPARGRFLSAADDAAGKPVCVVSQAFAAANGLGPGDSLKLSLGDRLFEQYAPLGAVASSAQRFAENWVEQEFEIVGTYLEADPSKSSYGEQFLAYGENAVFVPLSFLPVSEDALAGRPLKAGELSFVVTEAKDIAGVQKTLLPRLESRGIACSFSDGGWPAVEAEFQRSRRLSGLKAAAFAAAALLVSSLVVYLFIRRKKQEYALQRALGCPAKKAAAALFLPLLGMLVTGTCAGSLLAPLAFHGRAAGTYGASFSPWAVLAGGCAVFLLTAGMDRAELSLLGRQSVMVLLHGERPRRKARVKAPPCFVFKAPAVFAFDGAASGSRSVKLPHALRYVLRRHRRTIPRTGLCLLLALILCLGMGFLTLLREASASQYQSIEIKARFVNGLPYEQTREIENSGFVGDAPFYEYVQPQAESDFMPMTVVLTNDLSRSCGAEVRFREGSGPELLSGPGSACVVSRGLADALGLALGQKLRVTRKDFLFTLMANDPEENYETLLTVYYETAASPTVAGISEEEEPKLYGSLAAWRFYGILMDGSLELDTAEYVLADYHRAEEFRGYAALFARGGIGFSMDTSEADRSYQIYRLMETLYPIAFAVALLLGGVIPAVVILHGTQEAALLRILGATKRRTRLMLCLDQITLCGLGIFLAALVLFPASGAMRGTAPGPIALYFAAHLASCIAASFIAAVSVTKKAPLELLQVKE